MVAKLICGFLLLAIGFAAGLMYEIKIGLDYDEVVNDDPTVKTFISLEAPEVTFSNFAGAETIIGMAKPEDCLVFESIEQHTGKFGLEFDSEISPASATTNSDANPDSGFGLPVFEHIEQDVKIDYQRVSPGDR
ncbi:hypothetical protein [Schlesneria paludicola]|uniref:hypothetical protein n=1 Tax=Schlesneria paludicola TaxID=360056 RepID=UPI00029A050D|nr:hypothetical protein [Schlesneria paludicola]